MTINLTDREPKECISLGHAIAILLAQVKPEDIAPEAIVLRYPRKAYAEPRATLFAYYFMSTEGRNVATFIPDVKSFSFEPGEFGNGREYQFPVTETYGIAEMVQAQVKINAELNEHGFVVKVADYADRGFCSYYRVGLELWQRLYKGAVVSGDGCIEVDRQNELWQEGPFAELLKMKAFEDGNEEDPEMGHYNLLIKSC